MFNAHAAVDGVFEHPLNDYKSVQVSRVIHDFYETDESRGFYGGGGIDARPLWSMTPIFHALKGCHTIYRGGAQRGKTRSRTTSHGR